MSTRSGTAVKRAVVALGCTGAALLSGLGVLALVAVGVVALAAASFDGCDVSIDLPREQLGVTRNLDGTLVARAAPCRRDTEMQTVVVRRAGGPVVWSAHRSAGAAPLASVTLGRPPEGFVEDVALEGLDDGVAYELLLSPVPATVDATGTVPEAMSVFAATAAFRPEQVHVGRYLFNGAETTEAQFRRRACG